MTLDELGTGTAPDQERSAQALPLSEEGAAEIAE